MSNDTQADTTGDSQTGTADDAPGDTGEKSPANTSTQVNLPSDGFDRPGRVAALKSRTRLGKFASVGLVGAACDTTILVVLVEVLGVLEELAVVVGLETAILVMFLINDRWTFATEGGNGRQSVLYRLVRSHAVRAAGSTTHFLVFVVVYRVLFMPVTVLGVGMWILVAKAAGILTGGIVNYIFESLYTWRVHVGS